MATLIDRRQLIAGGLAAPFALAGPAPAAEPPVHLGDMHFHSFFGSSTYHARPVARTMADGGATLIAWSLVADLPWIEATRRGYGQKRDPNPGEAMVWFTRELDRIKAHIAEQGLKIVRGPDDVGRALKGEPHIVLAVEGANFIEADPARVAAAHALGVRHLQLVHYTRNPLGDIQTEAPTSNGLTEAGKAVVAECNRLGVLVDLAHSTPEMVRDALALSQAPVVWSHSSVTQSATPHWSLVAWRARQLTLAGARAIAAQGGVVGLWTLTTDVGRTTQAYADRMLELAQWLGEDHVAFGTDINGLGKNALLSTYRELAEVVAHWQRQHIPRPRIEKLAIGNYARVLTAALAGRR